MRLAEEPGGDTVGVARCAQQEQPVPRDRVELCLAVGAGVGAVVKGHAVGALAQLQRGAAPAPVRRRHAVLATIDRDPFQPAALAVVPVNVDLGRAVGAEEECLGTAGQPPPLAPRQRAPQQRRVEPPGAVRQLGQGQAVRLEVIVEVGLAGVAARPDVGEEHARPGILHDRADPAGGAAQQRPRDQLGGLDQLGRADPAGGARPARVDGHPFLQLRRAADGAAGGTARGGRVGHGGGAADRADKRPAPHPHRAAPPQRAGDLLYPCQRPHRRGRWRDSIDGSGRDSRPRAGGRGREGGGQARELMIELARALRAAVDGDLQAAHEGTLEGRAERWVQLSRRLERYPHGAVGRRWGLLPRRQMVERRGQRVDVGERPAPRLLGVLFERGITRREQHRLPQRLVAGEFARRAEVDQHGARCVPPLHQDDVLRLDVAVQQALIMHRLEGVDQRSGDRQQFRLG